MNRTLYIAIKALGVSLMILGAILVITNLWSAHTQPVVIAANYQASAVGMGLLVLGLCMLCLNWKTVGTLGKIGLLMLAIVVLLGAPAIFVTYLVGKHLGGQDPRGTYASLVVLCIAAYTAVILGIFAFGFAQRPRFRRHPPM